MPGGIYKGSRARIRGTFSAPDSAGNLQLVDPAVVSIEVVAPDGTATEMTPTKDAVGTYSARFVPLLDGRWTGRLIGTGSVEIVRPFVFYVQP
jgi:hypothetical protein